MSVDILRLLEDEENKKPDNMVQTVDDVNPSELESPPPPKPEYAPQPMDAPETTQRQVAQNTSPASKTSDLVRAYIQRMNAPAQRDLGLEAAQKQGRKIDFINTLFGREGHNFGDPDSPVKQYLQMKAQGAESRKADLDGLKGLSEIEQKEAAANKSNAYLDPNGPYAQAQLIKNHATLEKLRQADDRLNWAEKNGADKNDIARRRAELQSRRNSIMQDQLAISQGRLGLQQTKAEDSINQNQVGGLTFDHPEFVNPKEAAALRPQVAALNQIKDEVKEFKGMRDPDTGYLHLPMTAYDSRLKQLRTFLLPLATTAGGFGNLTVAHQHLAEQIVKDPSKLGMINADALDAQLDGLVDDVEKYVNNRAARSGGHLNKPGEAPQAPTRIDRKTSKIAAPSASEKTVKEKLYSPSRNKTKITYSDGSTEIVDGRQG